MTLRTPEMDEVALRAVRLLRDRLEKRTAVIGVIGLGYVGLPLALACCKPGFTVIGFDIDSAKVEVLNRGESPIKHIPSEPVASARAAGQFEASADFQRLNEPDALMICVPTPLGAHREPDLGFVEATTRSIAARLRPGQLVILESTTYPGTTREVLKPILEASGLQCGIDFFLAYSPEREDPGNSEYDTARIPKIVAGDGEAASVLAQTLYNHVVARTVPVSNLDTAEAVKITENIFRAVNIALVNELKMVYAAMGIDIFEVIDAAKTKPFGFMPFYPGPGLGGHCIPIDPFYLTWKAREFHISTRFVELAGEVNAAMPRYVVERLRCEIDRRFGKGLSGTRILIVGVAYKKNVDDLRESPALEIIKLLDALGAKIDYHDPYFPVIPPTREYPDLAGKASVPLEPYLIARYDAALIVTDHSGVDYDRLLEYAKLVVDTRHVIPPTHPHAAIVARA